MSRSREEPPDDLLFDLPLEPEPADTAATDAGTSPSEPGQEQLSFAGTPPTGEPAENTDEIIQLIPAPLGPRLLAAALDIAALALVLIVALAFLLWLNIRPDLSKLPPLAMFLASFSFVYFVVPLAFWGHTPGMAQAGLWAQAKSQKPLTIQQAVLRWLGFVLAVASAGLLGLLTLAGVSPADLISRSRVFLKRRTYLH